LTRPDRVIDANPDVVRWNRKYENIPGNAPQPVDAHGEAELAAQEHFLNNCGTALELASGRGRNALYIASLGYDVIAADCALNGLRSCQATARSAALPVYPMGFDLVSVVRFLHRPLFAEITSWLRPGGLLFYKTFSTGFLSINPRFNPDYLVRPGELIHAFRHLQLLASDRDYRDTAENPETGTSFILARQPQ
jgi:SAM-dependent methyltransferase